MVDLKTKIDFRPFLPTDKSLYEDFLFSAGERGCEFSFGNLYLWGRQSFAKIGDNIVLFSQFDRRTVYPYPIIKKDAKAIIDAIIADAKARGIPCRITGLSPDAAKQIEALYPQKFKFHNDRDSYDYVYDINDLAELTGKKYHSKKNHLNRFMEVYEGYTAEPINKENIDGALLFAEEWFKSKEEANPDGDYMMERAAIRKAFKHYFEIGLEGLIIKYKDEIFALTIGSRLSDDTFDVHFEKARADINGAYTVVNYEFARYIREKYPEIKYLDREEDMGIEGLRKAKESYKPHHLIEKCWAHLLEEGYDY